MSKEFELKSIAKWREQSNPLIALSPERLVTMRQQGRFGIFAELQWFYFCAMRACPTLAALRARRRSAIQRLDWDIGCVSELPAGCTEDDVEAQEQALRHAYERIDNLNDAFRFLSLAPFHGYAHMQKHRDSAGAVVHLEPLDQWNWVRDGLRGQWLWNPTAMATSADAIRGAKDAIIDPKEFLIVEEELPIIEACLSLFFQESIGTKDWSHFVEIFGIPGAVIIGPQNVAPGSTQEDDFKEASQLVADGESGYLPYGSDIKFSTDPRNQHPFREYIEDKRAQMILVGTGGKLTMLAESGSGTLAGGAHQDAFDQIAEAEAAHISEVFQRGIDAEVLGSLFPDKPKLAYFELCGKEESNPVAQVDMILKLSQAGFDLDEAEVSERTGFKVTKKQPLNLTPATPDADAVAAQDEPDDEIMDDSTGDHATDGATVDAASMKASPES